MAKLRSPLFHPSTRAATKTQLYRSWINVGGQVSLDRGAGSPDLLGLSAVKSRQVDYDVLVFAELSDEPIPVGFI